MTAGEKSGAFRSAWRRATDNPWLLLLATMFIWGANAPVLRLSAGEISPMAIVTLRWGIVAIVIYFLRPPAFARDWQVARRKPLTLASMAVLMTCANALIFTAAKYTSGINLSILQGVSPVIIIVGARIAFGVEITALRAIGVTISLLGVVLLATQGNPLALRSLTFNVGDIYMLASVVVYAIYALALRARPDIPNYSFFCFIAIGSFIVSLPLLGMEILEGAARWPTLKGLAALLYIAIFTSMLGQLFFMRAVELVGAARAAPWQNLPPVIGALLSVMFIGETFAMHHLMALVLVTGGIIIAERRHRA